MKKFRDFILNYGLIDNYYIWAATTTVHSIEYYVSIRFYLCIIFVVSNELSVLGRKAHNLIEDPPQKYDFSQKLAKKGLLGGGG